MLSYSACCEPKAEQTEELVPNRWPLVVAHSCDAIMQTELCEEQRALVASELGVENELEAIFGTFICSTDTFLFLSMLSLLKHSIRASNRGLSRFVVIAA